MERGHHARCEPPERVARPQRAIDGFDFAELDEVDAGCGAGDFEFDEIGRCIDIVDLDFDGVDEIDRGRDPVDLEFHGRNGCIAIAGFDFAEFALVDDREGVGFIAIEVDRSAVRVEFDKRDRCVVLTGFELAEFRCCAGESA
jgi:hypothetical protein